MSDTYEDAQADDYLNELYNRFGPEWADEHRAELNDQAIQAFKSERLQSYYLAHPDIARAPLTMMVKMEALLSVDRPAALVFAVSAIEITIKHVLVKPILSGLVHDEAVADLLMDLVPRDVRSKPFRQITFGTLKKVVGVDLVDYRRKGATKTLWEEYTQLLEERNRFIHSGALPSSETLAIFDLVAIEFLKTLFPKTLETLGLHVTGTLLIAEDSGVDDEEDPDLN